MYDTSPSTSHLNSPDVAISVSNVSKAYRIWRDPSARLKAPLWEAVGKFIPKYILNLNSKHNLRAGNPARYYKDFYALQNVSFNIRKGESVGIVGMNGSGKSTLLQILAGTLTPTAGSIEVRGRVAALLELGSGFNPEFSGRENIYLNCAVLGLSKSEIDQQLDAIIDFSEIGEFIDQPVRTYSSGMVVRLAFAALSHVKPDILIIDEALAVGDAYFQHKCIQRIKTFQATGGTLLFVSHDSAAVKSICQRAILIESGSLIKDGPAETVLDYYNATIAKKENDQLIEQTAGPSGRVVTRAGNRKLFISHCNLLDYHGKPSTAYSTGDTLCIVANVACHAEVSEATFGILIRDRLGVDVYGTNTHHQGQSWAPISVGQNIEITTEVVLNLGPGSYSITLAVHSGKDHIADNFDWMDNALIFQIMPTVNQAFIGCAKLPCCFTYKLSA